MKVYIVLEKLSLLIFTIHGVFDSFELALSYMQSSQHLKLIDNSSFEIDIRDLHQSINKSFI